MKMSHEKKKLRVYICFLKYEGGHIYYRKKYMKMHDVVAMMERDDK